MISRLFQLVFQLPSVNNMAVLSINMLLGLSMFRKSTISTIYNSTKSNVYFVAHILQEANSASVARSR